MIVKLLTDGGYCGSDAIVGKIVEATAAGKGAVDVSLAELEKAGYVDDGSGMDSLYFYASEVEVLDKDG